MVFFYPLLWGKDLSAREKATVIRGIVLNAI